MLYVDKKWPDSTACHSVAAHLRKRFNTNVLTHFRPEFQKKVGQKVMIGQPVAFTDIFGMAIGDALLEVSVHELYRGASVITSRLLSLRAVVRFLATSFD